MKRQILIIPLLAHAIASGAENDQIIVGDELRTAFYEVAPKNLKASMRNAVDDACAQHGARFWFCRSEPLSFLRGIYVSGFQQKKGYVCPSLGMEDWTFFPPDIAEAEDSTCVRISYDEESNRHYIDSVYLELDHDEDA